MNLLQPLLNTLSKPLPVYLCVGSESLLVRQAEDEIRKAVISGSFGAFNDAVFTAGEESALGFMDVAATAPMMAPKRLIVIRQLQDANSALMESLLTYAGRPFDSTILALCGDRLPPASGGKDMGTRLSNAVKKAGLVVKLDGEGADPAAFAAAQAKERKVTLQPQAAQLLASLANNELTRVAAEVEKCADYVGEGGTITPAIVEEVCSFSTETEVWALTDALVSRDRAAALDVTYRLLEDGEPSHKILGMVLWQLRQILTLQDAQRRGLSDREVGVRMPPKKIEQIKKMVTQHPMSPSGVLEEVAVANRQMNSSRAGDRRIFEALVLRLTL